MKWDVKIALYSFLVYTFYGLSYYLSNGDFVVPYPVLPIVVPLVALVYLFTTKLSKFSPFYLLIPLGTMAEWLYLINPNYGDLSVILSVLAYILLGAVIFSDANLKSSFKKNKLFLLSVILFLLGAIMLIANSWVTNSYLLAIAIVTSVLIRDDEEKYNFPIPLRRLLLFISFNAWMYLITWVSHVVN